MARQKLSNSPPSSKALVQGDDRPVHIRFFGKNDVIHKSCHPLGGNQGFPG
jgi:hypothetical protein